MGEILQFRPRREQKFSSRDRIEAMVKGQLETYVCGRCNGEFEVLRDNKPTFCPCCKTLLEWE